MEAANEAVEPLRGQDAYTVLGRQLMALPKVCALDTDPRHSGYGKGIELLERAKPHTQTAGHVLSRLH